LHKIRLLSHFCGQINGGTIRRKKWAWVSGIRGGRKRSRERRRNGGRRRNGWREGNGWRERRRGRGRNNDNDGWSGWWVAGGWRRVNVIQPHNLNISNILSIEPNRTLS
jgi:hypothetical protein